MPSLTAREPIRGPAAWGSDDSPDWDGLQGLFPARGEVPDA